MKATDEFARLANDSVKQGECPAPGDNREVTNEANIRLCAWLRTTSPPKKQLYGNGNGSMYQRRRDVRAGGYGFVGPRAVQRSPENWRHKKLVPEDDGGRNDRIRGVGEKEKKVTYSARNGNINGSARGLVHGKSNLDGCQSSGPKDADESDISNKQEETGWPGGVVSEIVETDQVMGCEEGLGLNPYKEPELVCNNDSLIGPISTSDMGEGSDSGLPMVDNWVSSQTQVLPKSGSTWKRVGRINKFLPSQSSLGVNIGKRESDTSRDVSNSSIKRTKNSNPKLEKESSQQTNGVLSNVVGVESETGIRMAMGEQTRGNRDRGTMEMDS
ncbi:hypothetical protein LWI29_018278 [Acer saccharum]|uniref:Uncharacterized protein n=1 Tax=Acer saccharum TaxID=4024 RepID=A0AA39VZT3_ACESA|nr:hypothetical protein LWI29_018278 [Acer saccharum]